jgi:hypothetical protein
MTAPTISLLLIRSPFFASRLRRRQAHAGCAPRLTQGRQALLKRGRCLAPCYPRGFVPQAIRTSQASTQMQGPWAGNRIWCMPEAYNLLYCASHCKHQCYAGLRCEDRRVRLRHESTPYTSMTYSPPAVELQDLCQHTGARDRSATLFLACS